MLFARVYIVLPFPKGTEHLSKLTTSVAAQRDRWKERKKDGKLPQHDQHDTERQGIFLL